MEQRLCWGRQAPGVSPAIHTPSPTRVVFTVCSGVVCEPGPGHRGRDAAEGQEN